MALDYFTSCQAYHDFYAIKRRRQTTSAIVQSITILHNDTTAVGRTCYEYKSSTRVEAGYRKVQGTNAS